MQDSTPNSGHSYWASYSLDHHLNPDEVDRTDLFRLTIILDRELLHTYSKLRLLIVDDNPHAVTNDVSLRATPWHIRSWSRSQIFPGLSPNKLLQQSRLQPRPRHSSTKLSNEGETCTVVLSLNWHIRRRSCSHDLSLLPFSQLHLSTSKRRILLDQTYEARDFDPSLFLLVESTSDFFTTDFIQPQRGTLRISPFRSSSSSSSSSSAYSRRRLPRIPSHLFLRIVKINLQHLPETLWLTSLLPYALVAKSWLCVLDLFYSKHPRLLTATETQAQAQGPGGQVVSPHIAFSTLQKSLTKTALMKSFNVMEANPYSSALPSSSPHRMIDISFLSNAISLTTLTLNWDFFLSSTHSHILRHLPFIEKFTLTGWKSEHVPGSPMSLVLREIHEWEKLKELTLNRWLKEEGTPESRPPILPCSYRLQSIHLMSGMLYKAHVSHFFPSHPTPALTTLYLTHITTSNSILSLLLSSTAPTLESIDISSCSIPPPKNPKEEPFAIDAHISRMTRLRELVIPGTCCSYLVLLNKTSTDSNTKNSTPIRIHIESATWTLFFLGSRDGKALLKSAIETTGWSNIRISPSRGETFWSQAVDTNVESEAERRGIPLLVEGVGVGGSRPRGGY